MENNKRVLANDGIDPVGKKLLEDAGFLISTEKVSQEKLANEINQHNFSVLTVRSATQVRKELIDACPGLKVIGRGGVGMDNIDVEYAKSKGIQVINTPAASSNSVAELVFAHLYGMVRFIPDSNRKMPIEGSTKFEELKKKYSKGTELRGKTIGIIGFGRIGQSLAKIALGNGMKVIAHDPFLKEVDLSLEINGADSVKIKIETQSLEHLYSSSDIISLHVPGGKLIGTEEIAKMKNGVMLINASRGGVIDESALLEALNSGKISQAALDVFVGEPFPNQELLSHLNISLTPHIGASTNEAQERIGVELAEKIIAAFT